MTKATLVLLLAHVIIPRLQRRSAAERHVLWVAALAVAAMLPVFAATLPSWQPEWAPEWTLRVGDVLPGVFTSTDTLTTSGSHDVVVRATGVESLRSTLSDLLRWLWVAGSIAALFVLLIETVRLKRLMCSAVSVHGRMLDVAGEVVRDLQLTHTPRLFISVRNAMPLAWGLTHPSIVLPATARDWSDDRLRAVLAHELAHLRRGDWLVHVIAELICASYWFHPLVWIARDHMRRESERAADDLVLSLGTSGTTYAGHLIEIVRAARSSGRIPATTVGMARHAHLEQRVAALLDGLTNRTVVTLETRLWIALIAVAVTVPVAAFTSSTLTASVEVHTDGLQPIPEIPGDPGPPNGPLTPFRHVRVVSPPPGAWTPPQIAEYTTPPLYSDDARRQRIEGVFVARAHIDARGDITDAQAVKGLGFGLDQNALVALRQWRFEPGTRAGVPEAMNVEIDIEFTLRNDAINAVVANDMATLVGPGVTPPRAVRSVTPAAQLTNVRGTVVLDVLLLENGTPRIVRILRSLSPEADDTAVRTFEQWRFSPALRDGRPVKVRLNAEVNFHG